MTLVVAHQDDNNVLRLIADMRINDERAFAESRNTIYKSKIKAIVLHPKIAFAYANKVAPAEEAIKQLFKDLINMNNVPISRVCQVLMHFHQESNKDTDFLICDGFNNEILQIKDGELNGSGRYIGDHFGFEKYQEQFITSSDSHLNTKMLDSMNAVIHNTSVDSVGGYETLVTNKEAYGFQYAEVALVHREREKTIDIPEKGAKVLVPFGTVEEGTGSILQFAGCCIRREYLRATGFYSTGTTKGLLFLPWISIDPLIVQCSDGKSFIENSRKEYGVGLNGFDYDGKYGLVRISSFK
ncbi:hypothetical protein [Pseudoalteromonas sp. S16_S37]|uniref:hypothetical protein n=1 Tax=Pseudoalteromonas sp. S16_S37 TaxID=2720228 RepID=UPI0016815BDC|nr:hypothetical protein [Pseudoalteromonas sp. S16_S37]MBD1581381.1 hypothetical protein [Pseudoalteromonas sp. S16_S37]